MSRYVPTFPLEEAELRAHYTPRLITVAMRALAYPETSLEAPWGYPVIKVAGKILCILDETPDGMTFTCKLRELHAEALEREGVAPTGHGLGKSGWVTRTFPQGQAIPYDELYRWLDEALTLIAPKRVVKAWQATQEA